MRIAYIIHAYKLPKQLKRLIEKLNHPDAYFFIHIDRKSDIKVFRNELFNVPQEKIEWVKRERSHWGHISTVKGVLHGLKSAMLHPAKFDYFQLLSGQCYPIQSSDKIHEFFSQHCANSFIENFQIDSQVPEHWRARVGKYHFRFGDRILTYPLNRKPSSAIDYLLLLFGVTNLRVPREYKNWIHYGGSFYLSLSRASAQYVLDFVRNQTDYISFHQFTLIPEETFFQSILLNSGSSQYLINKSLTYVQWGDGPNPLILKESDFDSIQQSGLLFARKFDQDIDSSILDKIDLLLT